MRPAALAAVVMHVVHLAVMPRGEPVLKMLLVAGKLDTGDAERIKPMRACEYLQILFHVLQFNCAEFGHRGTIASV